MVNRIRWMQPNSSVATRSAVGGLIVSAAQWGLLAALLGGCGQKGPLTLPSVAPPASAAASVPGASAPSR
jgi:predicted small lipoprotein YifL